jgi:hypothetical protein
MAPPPYDARMSPLLARSLRLAIVLVGITLGVGVFVLADQRSHSASDTLYAASVPVLVVFLGTAIVLWVVGRGAGRP